MGLDEGRLGPPRRQTSSDGQTRPKQAASEASPALCRPGSPGGAIRQRDGEEFMLEGVAGGAAHADIGDEPDENHGADAALLEQPLPGLCPRIPL